MCQACRRPRALPERPEGSSGSLRPPAKDRPGSRRNPPQARAAHVGSVAVPHLEGRQQRDLRLIGARIRPPVPGQPTGRPVVDAFVASSSDSKKCSCKRRDNLKVFEPGYGPHARPGKIGAAELDGEPVGGPNACPGLWHVAQAIWPDPEGPVRRTAPCQARKGSARPGPPPGSWAGSWDEASASRCSEVPASRPSISARW